jgi:hypothetical protein
LGPRPAISRLQVRAAMPAPDVFSVPVLMENQGSAPTAAGDVTVDDAECPRMANTMALPSCRRGTCIVVRALIDGGDLGGPGHGACPVLRT